MNKVAYENALYSAFFDELEKLGFPVDDMAKEALFREGVRTAKTVGQKLIEGVKSLTPTGKMEMTLAKPEMRGLSQSLSGAPVPKIRPSGPVFTDPAAAAVRSRMGGQIGGARSAVGQGQRVGAGTLTA